MDMDGIVKKALSRRTFLAGAGSAAAATLVVGCSDDGTVTLPVTSAAVTDFDILNFALNLEYLEAEFYLIAATGKGLSATDAGTGAGTTTGGSKVVPTAQTTGLMLSVLTQQNIINELAYTEQQHVRAIRATITALGGTPVSRPNIDFTASFAAFASLAQVPATFSPFANFDSFIIAASNFEGVGVTAYNGAAPLLSATAASNGVLAAAAGIMAVEAYHDGAGRAYVTGSSVGQTTTAYPYLTYANQFAVVRSQLSGGTGTTLVDEKALVTPTAASGTTTGNAVPSTVVPADTNALAFARTTDQVLHIVYGKFSNTTGVTTNQAGVAAGGFFPNGLNGNIKVTQS